MTAEEFSTNWDRVFGTKPMETDAINKWLHENVMGERWCEKPEEFNGAHDCECGVMHSWRWYLTRDKVHDYCNSLDAVANVEAKVIEKVGRAEYYHFLSYQVAFEDVGLFEKYHIITATAQERAAACREAWNNK